MTTYRGTACYLAACRHALAGEPDHAFAALTQALDRGFRDPDQLDGEGDFASLRADARWAGAVARAKANLSRYLAAANPELYAIYQADQGDRAGDVTKIDWSVVAPRDQARLRRVNDMMADRALVSAADHLHAAMIFQHGHTAEDFATASRLAERAASLDPSLGQARWLAAAARDRELVTRGKPQRYGTQYLVVDDKWTLREVDPTVTDEERAAWEVVSLAEAQAHADRKNNP